MTKTENEIIAEFMAAKKQYNDGQRAEYLLITAPKGFAGNWYEAGNLRYHESWDWLMPVVTLLLNKLRFTNWKTRDQHEWAEVHRTHLERRLLDYIYDDTTSQSDFVQEIIEVIKWYNTQNSNPTSS